MYWKTVHELPQENNFYFQELFAGIPESIAFALHHCINTAGLQHFSNHFSHALLCQHNPITASQQYIGFIVNQMAIICVMNALFL